MPYLRALTGIDELTSIGAAKSSSDSSSNRDYRDATKVSRRIVCEMQDGVPSARPMVSVASPVNDFWASYQYGEQNIRFNSSHEPVTFRDANGDKVAAVVMAGTGVATLRVFGSATETSATFGYSASLSQWVHHIDDTGTDRTYTLYIDGVQVAQVSTPKGSRGGVVSFEFWYKGAVVADRFYSSSYSEIILADGVNLNGQRLGENQGYLAGFHSDFAGSVSSLSSSEGSMVSEATGDRVSVDPDGYLGAAGAASIRAVVTGLTGELSGSTITTIAPSVRIAGTDYDLTPVTLSAGAFSITGVWENNPDTAAAWSATDVASVEYGVVTG